MSHDQFPTKLAYTVRQFCDGVGIGHTKFYQEVSEGRIKTVKCGSRTLVTATEATRYIAALSENVA